MSSSITTFRGVVHGKTIELEQEPGLPDGQPVTVAIHSLSASASLAPGEGIKQSAGGWADAGGDLDEWLEEMKRSRQIDRPELL